MQMESTDSPWLGDAVSLVDAFRRKERSPLEELQASLEPHLDSKSTSFLTQHRYEFYSGKQLFGSTLCRHLKELHSRLQLEQLESGQYPRQEEHPWQDSP